MDTPPTQTYRLETVVDDATPKTWRTALAGLSARKALVEARAEARSPSSIDGLRVIGERDGCEYLVGPYGLMTSDGVEAR